MYLPAQYFPYVLFLTVMTAVTCGLVVYAWRRPNRQGLESFFLVMTAIVVWSGCYILELVVPDLGWRRFFVDVKYIGIAFASVGWLAFCWQYTQRELRVTGWRMGVLSIIPAITVLLVFTNDWHGLMFESIVWEGTFAVVRGPWSWVHITYTYILVMIGLILLIQMFIATSGVYRWQVLIVLIGGLMPFVANGLYLMNLNPLPGLDLTPFGFTFSGIMFALGVFRYRLLDIMPVAREKLIENMADGLLVLDKEGRVVYMNPTVYTLLERQMSVVGERPLGEVTGQLVADVLAHWPALGAFCVAEEGAAQTEIAAPARPEMPAAYFDARVSPLLNPQGQVSGRLVVLRDITALKMASDALRAEQEKSEQLLRNILPDAVAERLKQGEQKIVEQFDEATILFADMVGFTSYSSTHSAAAVLDVLNIMFSAFDEIADRYDLEKIKTIGDAYMVAAGIPEPRDDHAETIAEMALEMKQVMARIRQNPLYANFQVRIGMSCGPVIAGVIGTKKFAYDVWGDTVNIASRMESNGVPGKIMVSPAIYEKLKEKYQFEVRPPMRIKGKGEMVTYFLLEKVKDE